MNRVAAPLMLAIGILPLALSSCAVIPARLVQSHSLGGRDCPLEPSTMHGLLQLALETPNKGQSAHALGHFVEIWNEEKNGQLSAEVSPSSSEPGKTTYQVHFRTSGADRYDPAYFDVIKPAVDFQVKKIDHHKRDGIGCPLKALRENTGRDPIESYYPPEAITREATAVIHPGPIRDGKQSVEIELLCTLKHRDITVAGKSEPLAADYSIALAAMLERAKDLSKSEFADLLTPTPGRDPQLYLMERYDPKKEPLIMIHGLLDSPLTWAELTNTLRGNDELRERYQIWHYLYNTSAPGLYSGRILRTQYRELRRKLDPSLSDPAMQRTTLLTHSMGGIVARSLITDPGDAFWEAGFTRPLDSLVLSDEDRAALIEAFLWKPEPSVKSVIFITVPHRGSHFADNPVGKLGESLVKPPNKFKAFYERISTANPGAFTEIYAELGKGNMDSVSSLSPRQPTLQILPDLPLGHPVALHSIIGNRGRSGPIEDSSDGVVEYWSSHLDDVDSEVIIPHNHRCLDKKETIEEVFRILLKP